MGHEKFKFFKFKLNRNLRKIAYSAQALESIDAVIHGPFDVIHEVSGGRPHHNSGNPCLSALLSARKNFFNNKAMELARH